MIRRNLWYNHGRNKLYPGRYEMVLEHGLKLELTWQMTADSRWTQGRWVLRAPMAGISQMDLSTDNPDTAKGRAIDALRTHLQPILADLEEVSRSAWLLRAKGPNVPPRFVSGEWDGFTADRSEALSFYSREEAEVAMLREQARLGCLLEPYNSNDA